MPYNNIISRSDAAALIPEDVASEVIKRLPRIVRGADPVSPCHDGTRAAADAGHGRAARRLLRERRHRSEADDRGGLGEHST